MFSRSIKVPTFDNHYTTPSSRKPTSW